MKKKIIFIIIESVRRELNSKTLLSLKALKKNYRVLIGQKGSLRQVIKNTNPGIMILKSFGPKNTKHIDFIKKKNFKVVSSDEELITALDFESKINYRMNNENIKKLDLLLAVGEKSDYPIIKKKFSTIINNTLVCGNIRLELLKRKYRNILEKETTALKNKYGDFVLILTSFHSFNKIQPDYRIDWVYEQIAENNADPDSYSIRIREEETKMQRDQLLETLKFINNFEKNFPNKKLVISPHPTEKYDFWTNYVKKKNFKNIFIYEDRHSSSHALINACEVLISNNSTTLLEGYFLEKKIINLLTKDERISEIDLLKKISNNVRSSDDLCKTINSMQNKKNEKYIKYKIEEVRNFDDNFDSFESILENLDKLNNVKPYDSLFSNYFQLIICKFRMIKNYIKKIISNKLNINPIYHRFHREKVGTRLQKNNFIKNVEHINSFEKVESLSVKQIAPEVFLLDSLKKY